ncbi:hypothetical protein PPYR_00333 [Photinus pyralis]|uniref:DUF4806 domain-containing protein n=2 Tax=Photinus pyralis TaxID=7054 RepID=A0A1Y1LAN4_PHOPY|nr:uncharacterized protein LOC116159863 [Photinus pyralis]XP_031351983.1 uncharacterized protein LOC116177209 isoform X2 [Photinus pyralis]XP_031355224.1 uncharacterized protein LOC116179563 [Photinus pyralis]KAB0803363.1 hypothetical protein PPYR_00333 [Photinus pyralis]
MEFLGVEFSASCGGGLAIINRNWLTPRKKNAFWPPYKTQSVYEKALKTGETPNEANWKIYPVSRCFFETDDYSKARSKLKRAELQSDVQSDADEDSCLSKRAIHPPKRLCYESSDEEGSLSTLPAPPPINISELSKNLLNAESAGSPGRSPHSNPISIKKNRPSKASLIISEHDRQTPAKYNDVTSGCSSSLQSTPYRIRNKLFIPDNLADNLETEDTEICETLNEGQSGPSSVLNSRVSSPNLNHTIVDVDDLLRGTHVDYHDKKYKTLLRLLIHIKSQNDHVAKQNEAILKSLKKREVLQQSNTSYQLPNDVPVKIPIQQLLEIPIIEEYLSEEDHLCAMSAYLSTLGGRDITTKTNTILRSVISNKVAINFSFLGTRNNKQAFTKLNLNKLIIRAVQLSTPNTPEHEINENVKVWLKHAPQRLTLENKKQKENK